MKHALVAAAALLFSTSAMAERVWELNTGKHVQVFPHRGRASKRGGPGSNSLSYHNGPVIHQAKVVPVFWGSSGTWGTNGAPSALAQALISFFAQFGTYDSCGGPNLTFCAYHANFSYSGVDVKYASLPYPSCGGCQWYGWTAAQNFEHFACHETREAATDPDGNAWYDRQGNEADDKCAWSPAPFLANGYGYQYEWSNVVQACVQTR